MLESLEIKLSEKIVKIQLFEPVKVRGTDGKYINKHIFDIGSSSIKIKSFQPVNAGIRVNLEDQRDITINNDNIKAVSHKVNTLW